VPDGKVAERAGESEDLPGQRYTVTFADWGVREDLEDKKGTSPDRFISVRVFFARTINAIYGYVRRAKE
jgi:hypothetical protein